MNSFPAEKFYQQASVNRCSHMFTNLKVIQGFSYVFFLGHPGWPHFTRQSSALVHRRLPSDLVGQGKIRVFSTSVLTLLHHPPSTQVTQSALCNSGWTQDSEGFPRRNEHPRNPHLRRFLQGRCTVSSNVAHKLHPPGLQAPDVHTPQTKGTSIN